LHRGYFNTVVYGLALSAFSFTCKMKSSFIDEKDDGQLGNQLEFLLGEKLRTRGFKLATAESCTGGLIGDRLTNVPGSSDYYLGGVVAYAYEAKVALIGVSWDTLQTYGAVSRETVLEMARGVRKALIADIAVSVSGIAGPGGGLPEKPVGTTWLGLSTLEGERARVYCFDGDREANKASSADAALQFVMDYLNGSDSLDEDFRDS
jgi:PncC family amidohydrolase